MNRLILIFPDQGSGFKLILSRNSERPNCLVRLKLSARK